MNKRDWRIVAATLLTTWTIYCFCVIWSLPNKPDNDPFWIMLTAAYPFIIVMIIFWTLAQIWKWAIKP